MAIVPQVYTLTATWTATQHAALWRSMLIDAGLMTDWYDSTTPSAGYEHRVLRLTNDAAKTYGYQFIWFMFYTGNIYIQFATGWNPSTHVPVGTQYVDYYNSTCSTSFAGTTIASLSTSSAQTYVRYTSGDATFIGGAAPLLILKSAGTVPSWLDLDKVAAFTVFQPAYDAVATAGGWRTLTFNIPYQIRRMVFAAKPFTGTASTSFAVALPASCYAYAGTSTGNDCNDPSGGTVGYIGAIRLPSFTSATNPAFSSNYAPIITGIDPFPSLNLALPSDFGIVTTIGTVASARDTITVTAGVEVWEVMASVAAASTNSLCFVARTT